METELEMVPRPAGQQNQSKPPPDFVDDEEDVDPTQTGRNVLKSFLTAPPPPLHWGINE